MGDIRFRLVLDPKMHEIVKEVCWRAGVTKAHAFINAFVVYLTLLQETESGRKVAIVDDSGNVEKTITLPSADR